MKGEIISIGTELLLGEIVNTNAQFLSKELAVLGIDVFFQQVVGDNEERLLEAYKLASSRADLIITSGGLGPTKDDLTKEIACKFLGKELKVHKESLETIKEYFKKQNKELSKSNEKQAYFPEDAIVLKNDCGTAPGMILEDEKVTMIVLPGPPREMESMFNREVKKYLEEKTDTILQSKVLRVFGVGESHMENLVQDIIDNSKNPTVAPYAKGVDVTLRITAKGKSEDECSSLIEPVEKEIRKRLENNIYGEGEMPLEHVVAKILCDNNLTVATAESCTGGMIAAKLISYPGISSVFMEGVITYSNEAKMKRLGVSEETLERFGAVSEETAKEMAVGIAKNAGVDVALVSTGIAGPGGGTEDKPVGLVYLGIYIKGKTIIKKCNFQGDRDKVRERATMNVLDYLRRELI